MEIDIKELIDFVLCKEEIEHNEKDIDNIMFSYGLKYNSKAKEV